VIVIRSSALLTVAAMAMLVAGVFSASLGLIYASIAVSILAALTLGAGVLLRRRELFGEIRPHRAAADVAGAIATGPGAGQSSGAGQIADDRARTGRAGRGNGGGDLSEGSQQAASGAGSGQWPGSIAAKGASATGRRGGERSAAHAAGRGRAVRPGPGTGPAARTPAPREPARGDRARTERDRGGRAPGDREPAGRPWGDREPAWDEPAARDRERGGPEPAGSELAGRGRGGGETAGRERPGSGRGRPGQDRGYAAARADRAGGYRDHDQDRDAAAQAGRDQAAAEREPAAWGPRERAAQGQEAATPQGEAFRLPSADRRAERARDDAARRGHTDSPPAGDDFWDRVSEELSGGSSQDPVRPAWPSTAGPRAMGTGAAARRGPAADADEEPEAAWSSPGYRQAGPASWGGEASRPAGGPDGDDEQAEGPEAGGSRRERMVPPYVDDLTRPRRDREPAGSGSGDVPAGDGSSPAAEEAGAAAGREPGSAWSAWSSFRASRTEEQAASGGHHVRGFGEQRDEDERRREPVGRAESEPTERMVPGDGGPAAGEQLESRATAGDAAGGDAGAGDETSNDESAAAATDVAEDERDAAGAAGADGVDGAAGSDAEAGEPAPATAGAGHAGDAAAAGEPGEAGAPGGEDVAGAGAAEALGGAEEDGAEPDMAKADGGAEADGTPLDAEVTIVPGVARYHRRGCILIRFLSDGDLETTTRGAAEATALVPCKACQPDKPDPSG
jgi:hypothetical protein